MPTDRPKPEPSMRTVGEDLDLDGDTLASRDGSSQSRPMKEEAPGLAPGTQAGRYMILDQLGRGGMGVVYKAYDPELDRRIALKLLSVKTGSQSQGDRARDRLLREAKALAQLSHPNVVSAYDVGTLDQDVFVAMELVEGKTLMEWVRETKPSVYAKVEVLTAAGRGIAVLVNDEPLPLGDREIKQHVATRQGRNKGLFGIDIFGHRQYHPPTGECAYRCGTAGGGPATLRLPGMQFRYPYYRWLAGAVCCRQYLHCRRYHLGAHDIPGPARPQ